MSDAVSLWIGLLSRIDGQVARLYPRERQNGVDQRAEPAEVITAQHNMSRIFTRAVPCVALQTLSKVASRCCPCQNEVGYQLVYYYCYTMSLDGQSQRQGALYDSRDPRRTHGRSDFFAFLTLVKEMGREAA